MSNSVLDQAIERLSKGEAVAIPTETVYGLAARIDLEEGIKKIFSMKMRPFFDPLIVHISSKEMAYRLTTDWSPLANYLAEHFWPGPLTLVLPKSDLVHSMITSGLPTVGIRMPKHSVALSLIEKVGVPLAAPSANRFGRTSPTTSEHVRSEFPEEDLLILEGGACEVGLESTVLSVRRDSQDHYILTVLRDGKITQGELERSLKPLKFSYSFQEVVDKKESPGHMKHHYMPEIPLVLVSDLSLTESQIIETTRKMISQLPDQVEGVQIRKPQKLDRAGELKLPEEASLASRLLYSELRNLGESKKFDFIYFRKTSAFDLEDWTALRDRLSKAASLHVSSAT